MKKFYVCTAQLRVEKIPGVMTFTTFGVAADETEAKRMVADELPQVFQGETVQVMDVAVASVKQEILEQAAIEVLGWKRPERLDEEGNNPMSEWNVTNLPR